MSSHKAYTDTQTHNAAHKPHLKNKRMEEKVQRAVNCFGLQFSRFQRGAAVHFHSSFLFRLYSLHLHLLMRHNVALAAFVVEIWRIHR